MATRPRDSVACPGPCHPGGRPPWNPPMATRPRDSVACPGPCHPGGRPPWNPPMATRPRDSVACPGPCHPGGRPPWNPPMATRPRDSVACPGPSAERLRMVLQRPHTHLTTRDRLDALHGRGQALDRGHARNPAPDRGGADLVPVHPGPRLAGAAERRVHDQIDLAIQDPGNDVR